MLEYDINFIPRGNIKSQVITKFLIEFNSPLGKEVPYVLTLLVDDAPNLKGSDIMIVLEGLDNILIEKSLRLEFRYSNDQVEYEFLIVTMNLVMEMGVSNLKA